MLDSQPQLFKISGEVIATKSHIVHCPIVYSEGESDGSNYDDGNPFATPARQGRKGALSRALTAAAEDSPMDDTQEAEAPQTLNLEAPKEQGAGSQDSNRVTQRAQFAFQPKTPTKGRKRMCVGTPRAPARLPTMHTDEILEAIAAAEARLNGRIELLSDSFKKTERVYRLGPPRADGPKQDDDGAA